MCRVLLVSRSGFYSWLRRRESKRQIQNRRLDARIKSIYMKSRRRYGSPKITEELRREGWKVSKNRVARRMRQAGLRSIVRRKYRPTTDSKHSYEVAPNLLECNFTAGAPDRVWGVSDITYIVTERGWLHLTVFLDLFSRFVVGWSLSNSLSKEIVLTALHRAIRRRTSGPGLIIHADRGVQYACNDFEEVLKKHGFIQNMSRKRDCWDNAVSESFFKILKSELVYRQHFAGLKDALRSIFEYIEVFYNRQRRHSTLGYLSPAEYEQTMKSAVCF